MVIATAVANVVGHADTSRNLITAVASRLGERRADLCVLFASPHFENEIEQIVDSMGESLRPRAFIGTTGEAVINGECEYEHQPALAVWVAHLPGAHVSSFHFSAEEDLKRLEDDDAFAEHLAVPRDAQPSFVLMGDPFSFGRGALTLLERLESVYPGRPAIGGMASAGDEPGQNRVIFDGEVLRHGMTGVALWGNVTIDTVVSQGCRPIGRHLVITKSEQNIIYQLGGRAPLQVVNEIFSELPARDRALVQERCLLVGRVINECQPAFNRGDFLIRNYLGFDQNTGAMAVSDFVRPGQTIQFHVRDGKSASEDLQTLLTAPRGGAPAGALLFSCNGRGTHLFADRNHDARAVTDSSGMAPVAGFFCAGEIGPVGERNFLHGHTASVGFFRPASA
jgi:small ligand-binding sensory domain FIST